MINRRSFINTAARGTIGAIALAGFKSFDVSAARKLNKVGVQLYTVRGDMGKDFDGTLAKVAAIGYKEVEFAGYYNRTPQQVKELLAKLHLEAPSAHVPLADLQTKLDKSVETANAIGHKLIVCPYLDGRDRKTLDDYKRHAATFNKAAEAFKKAGIEFAYHNHDFEFTPIDGKLPYDLLLAETDKNLVKMEFDIYWIKKANNDPLAYFNKHPGRFVALHVKDMDNTPKAFFTEVGRGTINFKEIFAQSRKAGVKYFFVEQDQCPGAPLDSLKISYDYLSKLEF